MNLDPPAPWGPSGPDSGPWPSDWTLDPHRPLQPHVRVSQRASPPKSVTVSIPNKCAMWVKLIGQLREMDGGQWAQMCRRVMRICQQATRHQSVRRTRGPLSPRRRPRSRTINDLLRSITEGSAGEDPKIASLGSGVVEGEKWSRVGSDPLRGVWSPCMYERGTLQGGQSGVGGTVIPTWSTQPGLNDNGLAPDSVQNKGTRFVE